MLLTICIPSLVERLTKVAYLIKKIEKQIDVYGYKDEVQILCHIDNRSVPLSYKRNSMQKNSKGKYFMHLDDDDDIADDFIKEVCDRIKNLKMEVDVITYDQKCLVGKDVFYMKCDLNHDFRQRYIGINPNDNNKIFVRFPWQWCCWNKKFKYVYRSDVDTNAREDQNWLKRVILEYPKTQHNIPKVLHQYNFQDPSNSTCQ